MIASKYTPPRLPRIVRRRRLLERIEACGERRLILVLGQPAQGKTTLAADYLAGCGRNGAWLHLDAEDGSEANFLLLLRHAVTRLARSSQEHGAGDLELVALTPRHGPGRFQARLAAVCSQLPAPADLVIDGVDRLAERAPALDLIQALIGQATPERRIFLLSRNMPPLPLHPLIVRQEAAVIDNDALAFTPAEIQTYFHAIHQMSLAPETVDLLAEVTGGWAGGLVIVSQSLSRIPEPRRPGFLREHLKGRFSADTAGYFSQEVFDGETEAMKRFLMASALLDDLDPETVARAVEPLPSRELLRDLVERNIFIETLPSDRLGTAYRYNPLFGQFLRNMARRALSPADRCRCLMRAGTQCRQRQDHESAARYFLRAGAFARAAREIRKMAMDLVVTGRLADLEKMTGAIPSDRIAADPWLMLYATLARRLQDGRQYIQALTGALERFEKEGLVRGQLLALAFLIEAHVFLGLRLEACTGYFGVGDRLLATLGNVPYYTYAKAMLWLQIGFGRIAGGFDPARGVSAARNAGLLALEMNDRAMQVNAGIVSALGYTMTGDFERADRTLADIRRLVRTGPYPEYEVLQRLVRLQLDLRKGDFAAVDRGRESLRSDITTFGMLFFYPAYVEAVGFFHAYQGRFDDARAAARHLDDLAIMDGNDLYRGLAARLYALIHYFAGDFADARNAAMRAMQRMNDTGTLYHMQARLLAGLAGIHLGDSAAAETEIKAVLNHALSTENVLERCQAHFALALLAHRRNDTGRRRAHLEEACDIADRRTYTHLVVFRPTDLKELVGICMDGPGDSPVHWPKSLRPALSAAADAPASETPSAGPAQAPPTLPAGAAAAEPITVRTFGGLQVRRGDNALNAGKPLTGKPKFLLMAIVSRGLRDIPKDVLIDDLWPESEAAAARQNFKVTLHRLRKAFGPPPGGSPPRAYIHLKDNRLSLDPALCRVDVEDFLQACKDVKKHLAGAPPRPLAALGRRIIALYRGDFLPEDLYTPWIDMKRLALRDEFVQTLLTLAEALRKQGGNSEAVECCQAILAVDPCQESPVRLLMQIHADQGRPERAEQAYRRLQASLDRHLGDPPSPELTRLFHRMRS